VRRRIWFERVFLLGFPPEGFPEILERVRGTPARLEERVAGLARNVATRSPGEVWSIQEHVGHLADLEPLWLGRLDDLFDGEERLRPADLANTATHEADHNAADMADVLARFRGLRERAVTRLSALTDGDLVTTALHPRLEQPMSVIDLYFFVAEHDDHHLATITRLMDEG
jgi:uncharacterized damage-inducible protein DinB